VVHHDLDSIHALADHYTQYFGPPHMVFHEKVSSLVHIDTYIFPATETRPYMTLATAGMSALPMTLPKEVPKQFSHDEVLLYLDYDWDFEAAIGYLPMTILRNVARYPHEFKTWLGPGHTIGQEGRVEPIMEASLLTDVLLRHPVLEEPPFAHVDLPGGNPCHFLWVVPLTVAESYVKRTDGTEAVEGLLSNAGIVTLDVDRECLVSVETRQQRRARVRAQRARSLRPRLKTVMELECEVCEVPEHSDPLIDTEHGH
jgi:hypothetical protein